MNAIESGTRAPRQFRWYPHAGQRHAIDRDLVPGEPGRTLCNDPIDAVSETLKVGCCDPTCIECDDEWRKLRAQGKTS